MRLQKRYWNIFSDNLIFNSSYKKQHTVAYKWQRKSNNNNYILYFCIFIREQPNVIMIPFLKICYLTIIIYMTWQIISTFTPYSFFHILSQKSRCKILNYKFKIKLWICILHSILLYMYTVWIISITIIFPRRTLFPVFVFKYKLDALSIVYYIYIHKYSMTCYTKFSFRHLNWFIYKNDPLQTYNEHGNLSYIAVHNYKTNTEIAITTSIGSFGDITRWYYE